MIDKECVVDYMFNFDVTEAGPWKRVVLAHCPPACLPEELAHCGSGWEVIHKNRMPLKESIRDKSLRLRVSDLKQIFAALGINPPAKPGSGKKGGIIKVDWCRVLVNTLFTIGFTDDFKKDLIKHLCGTSHRTVDVDILSAVAHLDTENFEAFRHLQKAAIETMELGVFGSAEQAEKELKEFSLEEAVKQTAPKVEKLKKQHAEQVNAKSLRNWGQTPDDLKTLLPGGGEIKGVFWMSLNKLKKHFRVDYPISAFVLSLARQF